MNPNQSFRSSSSSQPFSSRPSFSSFSSGRRSSASTGSSNSSRRQEARVTFDFFRRDSSSVSNEDSSARRDEVAMSNAGQRVIPAVFNLEPLGGNNAVTDATNDDEHDAAFSQAGGHDDSFRSDGATLFKRVTNREASFYERAEKGEWPTWLLPRYYGRTADGINIENLTYGMRRPCVIDLKMGVQTVEDDEGNLVKKLRMTALDRLTRSKSAGVRLEGLSMYRTMEKTRVKGSKKQSHTISARVKVSLQDVLTFFLTDDQGVRTDVAVRFQSAVESIRDQFEKNDKFRFIGSSILLIYDNDNRAPHMLWLRALRNLHTIAKIKPLTDDQISGLTRRTKCDVRMIDFAHTSEMPKGMERDEGYLTGLTTVIDALKGIRKYRDKPIFEFSNAVVDRMEEQRAASLSQGASAANSAPVTSEGGEMLFDALLGRLTPLQPDQEEQEDGEDDNNDSLTE